jgi:nucleoside-diphosphate-sugar epimerase
VTGGNGFVGRKIVEMLLEQGCEVTVFDIAQGQQDARVKCLVGNLVSKVGRGRE